MSRFYQIESEKNLSLLVRQDEHHIRGKRLGRHIEHDRASKDFPVIVTHKEEFKSILWEREGGPFDQGEMGSCTGNAYGGLLMTGPFFESGRIITEENCVEIYSEATKLDNIPGEYPPDDTGSTGLAVCKAGKVMGLTGAYHHAFTMNAALKALQDGPVITGVGWYDSFDEPDSTGLVRVAKGAVIRGGHEILASGIHVEYNSDGAINLDESIVNLWNSWGTSYGVGGQFRWSLGTWMYLMKEYGDITKPAVPLRG